MMRVGPTSGSLIKLKILSTFRSRVLPDYKMCIRDSYSVCKKILGPPPQEQVEDPNDVHTKKVVSTSVTHMFRKGGTRHGNLLGFSKDDLENHGRWTKRVIAKHYLTPIETPVVKSFAGYGKGEKYTLPRRFPAPVSYTHLDVYKRQMYLSTSSSHGL